MAMQNAHIIQLNLLLTFELFVLSFLEIEINESATLI